MKPISEQAKDTLREIDTETALDGIRSPKYTPAYERQNGREQAKVVLDSQNVTAYQTTVSVLIPRGWDVQVEYLQATANESTLHIVRKMVIATVLDELGHTLRRRADEGYDTYEENTVRDGGKPYYEQGSEFVLDPTFREWVYSMEHFEVPYREWKMDVACGCTDHRVFGEAGTRPYEKFIEMFTFGRKSEEPDVLVTSPYGEDGSGRRRKPLPYNLYVYTSADADVEEAFLNS